jgi:hypothetical protein
MGLTDAGITVRVEYGEQVDTAPTITSTPNPVFVDGTALTYPFAQDISDDGLSPVTYSLSNVLPNGLFLNASTGVLSYDGVFRDETSISSHALTVTDAVGSATSASFNISINSDEVVVPADWAARAAAATGGGTVTNFNTSGDALFSLDSVPNGNNEAEAFVKKSGGFSYKVPILPTDTTRSGEKSLWLFNDQHALAAGEEVYIQFRQYFPAYYIDHVWEGTKSAGRSQSWKQDITSSVHTQAGGVGSNTTSEQVLQGSQQRGYIQGYHRNNDGDFIYWDEGLSTPCSGSDFKHQPSIDRTGTTPANCNEAIAKYGGLFSDASANYSGRGNRDGGAFFFHKYPGVGNWVTFKKRIKTSPTGQTSSDNEYQVWAAYDGDTQWTELVNTTYVLGSAPIEGQWLVSYRTDGTANASRRESYTVYDELIVSSSDIALPAEPATALKTLADSLSPGQWGQLTGISGLDATNFAWGGFQALDYGSKGMFDDITGKLHLLHGVNPGSGHGYDCGAIDVDRRKLFWRGYNQSTIDVYDLDAGTWSSSPSLSGQWQVASSLTYNEHLGVCQFWDERQGLVNYDPIANSLSTMVPVAQTDTIGAGALHVASDYSPRQRKTVFGGGDSQVGMGSVDVNGTFSLESAAPFPYGPTRARMTHDPVSGDFMMMSASTLHRKDPVSGVWSTEHDMTGTAPNFSENAMTSSWDLVSAPVYGYTRRTHKWLQLQ